MEKSKNKRRVMKHGRPFNGLEIPVELNNCWYRNPQTSDQKDRNDGWRVGFLKSLYLRDGVILVMLRSTVLKPCTLERDLNPSAGTQLKP